MKTNITADQNSDWNLRLLAAQRQLYREGKGLRLIRTVGTVVLAVGAPLLLAVSPSIGWIVTTVGALWLGASFVVKMRTDHLVKQAAGIQEEFDTTLFVLPWNTVCVGNKPTPELVVAASDRFKGDREQLVNWYPNTEGVLYPLSVLLCQRANLVWDGNLRRAYAYALLAIVLAYLVVLIIYAVWQQQLVLEFLIGVLFPVLAVVLDGLDTALGHIKLASAKEATAEHVRSMWESGLKQPRSITIARCRSVQDCIFRDRATAPLVPDWWYNFWRTRYEREMFTGADVLRAEAIQASRTKPS